MSEFAEIEVPHLRELMARTYETGTTLVNCVVHAHMPITGRPPGCSLCFTDLRNEFSRAQRLNEWLNEWIDDAREVLTRQDAALQLVNGYEATSRQLTHLETREFYDALTDEIGEGEIWDVIRDGEALLRGLTGQQARMIEQFLYRIGEIADGIVSTINEEGGQHGPR